MIKILSSPINLKSPNELMLEKAAGLIYDRRCNVSKSVLEPRTQQVTVSQRHL